MDAMFNVFGFGMSSPEEKYKFFETQRNKNITEQKEKQSLWSSRKTYPKKEGYYTDQQKLLEKKYRTIPVSGGKADMTIDRKTQNIAGASLPFQTPPGVTLDKASPNKVYQDAIMQGGKGANVPNDLNWWQKLSGMFNSKFDLEGAKASWTQKGGFEGLMANPAFTMGLAFMQAGAEGKTLGQGSLDNVMKAAGISSHYKKIIEDRKQAPIQATAADIDEIKEHLKTFKISEPNMWEKVGSWFAGEDGQANYDRAAESIAIEYQKEVARLQKANTSGKPLVIDSTFKEKIIKKVINSGKIKRKKGWFGPLTHGTIEQKSVFKARGGPVTQGKAYVVGEEGPEVIIPHSSGNVLSNDDSQIFAMLLAANPQLQKVSKARAEKIMRSRFPEYFE